ncbi:DUF3244 domain-containing protein [Bacteroides intestinalis]|uniref:DUF3244 domain-containing protein n=1 Tax=Bacteroides intestinalis TaxID=329854 RepID=A0A139LBT9_9BACE|nr:DUF3244 domain-containing protein [Bacteroides intestinalis]KXT48896.1 hypothetical protein HMPREF2531_02762 [Bacteroides intestinalis]
MKNRNLLLNLFFYVFAFIFCTAINANNSERIVILKGKYQGVKPKFHTEEIPISVSLIDNTYISIQTLHTINQVSISIYKNGKLIETTTQILEAFSTEYLSLPEEVTGLYSLFISTPEEINLYGKFRIE